MATEKEVWKEIPEYPDYRVSNLGRVKSLKFGKERILKPRKHKDGYLQVILCNNGIYKTSLVHRLVAKAFLGIPDDMQIDHVNGIRTDNRLENLRVCSHSDNMHNRRKHKNNSTGYPGVYYNKKAKKYIAQICVNGRNKRLGDFNTPEEAFLTYKNTSLKLHGAFSPFVTRPEFKALEERVSTLERLHNLKANISKGVSS